MSGSRPVLLVMDFQHGIVERFSGSPVIAAADRAVKAARAAEIPVIFVRVAFRPGYPEVADSNKAFGALAASGSDAYTEAHPATQVHAALSPLPGEPVVAKRRVSAFTGSDLEVLLRGLGGRRLGPGGHLDQRRRAIDAAAGRRPGLPHHRAGRRLRRHGPRSPLGPGREGLPEAGPRHHRRRVDRRPVGSRPPARVDHGGDHDDDTGGPRGTPGRPGTRPRSGSRVPGAHEGQLFYDGADTLGAHVTSGQYVWSIFEPVTLVPLGTSMASHPPAIPLSRLGPVTSLL